MNRILFVGNDGSSVNPAGGGGACIARTRRFHKALTESGFHVDICSPNNNLASVSQIRDLIHKNRYQCLVAVSPHPAELAVLAGTELPMWIDMNGMHPAEVHLSGDRTGKPRLDMIRILSLQNSLLSRGDFFSAPSKRQSYSIMGELYLLGRMDADSRHTIPVCAIPNYAMSAPLSTGSSEGSSEFSIISTGSFNSWFDGITLFDALEYAMRKNINITFTATGGAVPFAEEQYKAFLKRLSDSDFKDRFRIEGWVSRDRLEQIQMTASAAVYTDIPCGETLLGARTRVLDWISRGIPVVCTMGAEISETIAASGMGIAVPQKSPEALGNAFLKLAAEPSTISEIKKSQELWRRGEGSMESVFKPLIEWCSNPERLPGRQLCSATVPEVSSTGYRRMILREVSSKAGLIEAIRFLSLSLIEKLKGHG